MQHVVVQGPALTSVVKGEASPLFGRGYYLGWHTPCLLKEYVTWLVSTAVSWRMIISAPLMTPCIRLYNFKQNFEAKQKRLNNSKIHKTS